MTTLLQIGTVVLGFFGLGMIGVGCLTLVMRRVPDSMEQKWRKRGETLSWKPFAVSMILFGVSLICAFVVVFARLPQGWVAVFLVLAFAAGAVGQRVATRSRSPYVPDAVDDTPGQPWRLPAD